MKLFSNIILAAFILISHTTYACDETCKREAAEDKYSVSFPSFLTWEYCENLRADFMTNDLKSLQLYSTKSFNTKYKGPIKNVLRFIDQRKSWLDECDDYFIKTRSKRIFGDDDTADSIFSLMDLVHEELSIVVLSSSTYTDFEHEQEKRSINEKFKLLFTALENHKNIMNLKGIYNYH